SLASASGKEGKMVIVPSFSNGRGDFSVSVKNKGFIPGVTKIVALLNPAGRNPSEFSEPALILDTVKSTDQPPTLSSETTPREETTSTPPSPTEEGDTAQPKPR